MRNMRAGLSTGVCMRFFIRLTLCIAAIFLAAPVLSSALAQDQVTERPYPTATPPYGIDVKRPVFGGACMGCPWGMLGIATMQALKPYGYDVQMCWVCHSQVGPRLMGDKAKPPQSGGNQAFVENPMVAPSPDAILDISATNEVNLTDAWNGTGAYVKDGKKRQNYRLIAALQLPNYLLAAVRKDSGIKSLAEIKDRARPTWIYVDGHNESTQELLKFYGITEEALHKNRGGFLERVTRELRGAADVIIHHGFLTNTPEQRVWYEATQISEYNFLSLDPKLIESLDRRPGYYPATTAAFAMRGMDKRIDTVMRLGQLIYVRDDTPEAFAYMLAKALDEQQHVFSMQAQPFYYDRRRVATSETIPLHPGAQRYYREVGYLK